eukprot:16006010-Heterocapsa_arctica.AAC.1
MRQPARCTLDVVQPPSNLAANAPGRPPKATDHCSGGGRSHMDDDDDDDDDDDGDDDDDNNNNITAP